MLKTPIKLSRYLGHEFKQLTADFTDLMLPTTIAPKANTPIWILGRLAVSMDLGLTLLGENAQCPTSWHEMFGLGSSPQTITPPIPTTSDLIKLFELGHNRLLDAADRATEEELGAKHKIPLDVFQNYMPTVGDAISYIMTTHLAAYLGELTMIRLVIGLPPVERMAP